MLNLISSFEKKLKSFLGVFHEMIVRKILDIMTIRYDTQKVSRYHLQIYRKFRSIMLFKADIRTNSLIYPIQGGYPEIFHMINS